MSSASSRLKACCCQRPLVAGSSPNHKCRSDPGLGCLQTCAAAKVNSASHNGACKDLINLFASVSTSLARRITTPLAEHQLFHEFHAFELHQLGVLFHSAVQGQPNGPRLGKCDRVLNCGLIHQMMGLMGVKRSVTSSDRCGGCPRDQTTCCRIARDLYHQRAALPATGRPSHPAVHRRFAGVIHIHLTHGPAN